MLLLFALDFFLSLSTLLISPLSWCRSCLCSSFFNPSRPSSLCSILAFILNLHSLLCGIDLPSSVALHLGHPSVAPYSLVCLLVMYILLTVGSGAATVGRTSHFLRSRAGACSSSPRSACFFPLTSVGMWSFPVLGTGLDGIPRMDNTSSVRHL